MKWGFPQTEQNILSGSQISQLQEQKLTKTFQQPQYQTQVGKQIAIVQKRIFCSLIGSLCSNNSEDQIKNFPKSFFGHASRIMVAPIMNPPASGIAYIHQSIQDAGFITQANAAEGVGFASLRPFLGVWKAFRNMTYMVLVLIIIATGFMIMFQYKIDSHTIISVQNALPRIVVALLAITFSYAMAGLLIDLTYVIILLIFQIFHSSGLPNMDPQQLQDQYLTSNILSFGGSGQFTAFTGQLYYKALINVITLIPPWLQVSIGAILTFATTFIGLRLANNNVTAAKAIFGHFQASVGVLGSANGIIDAGSFIGAFMSLMLGLGTATFAVYSLLLIVAIVGVLFLYFRIVFLLIGAYIQIIINVMFAPVFLILVAVPGQDGFSSWVKKLIGNLLVFPAVITLILVIQVIQGIGFNGGQDAFSMPLLYDFDTDVMAMVISGAMLFAIPNIVKDMVKRIAGEPAVKGGAGLLLGGAGILAGSAMGAASQVHTLSRLAGGQGELPGLDRIKGWITGKMKGGGHGGGSHGGSDQERMTNL